MKGQAITTYNPIRIFADHPSGDLDILNVNGHMKETFFVYPNADFIFMETPHLFPTFEL